MARVMVLSWLAVALLPAGLAAAASSDPADVVIAYDTAHKSGDIEAMLALFGDDAVIVDRLGYVHQGRDEARRVIQISIGRSRGLGVTHRQVSGEHVSWIEPSATPLLTFETVVDAVVQDGRIVRLVYRNDQAVRADQPRPGNLLPALVGMIAPLLVASLSVTVLCLATHTTARAAGFAQGCRGDLGGWSAARRK